MEFFATNIIRGDDENSNSIVVRYVNDLDVSAIGSLAYGKSGGISLFVLGGAAVAGEGTIVKNFLHFLFRDVVLVNVGEVAVCVRVISEVLKHR